jgi:hypothetical protein
MIFKELIIVQNSLLIFNGLIIVQTAFIDLEGTLHCTNSIWWSWRDSSLYKHHLFVQWRVPSRSSNVVCTMKSPFKINKCCLYNEESLQGHQMMSVQWRVPSKSTNAVCTMKSPFKVIKCLFVECIQRLKRLKSIRLSGVSALNDDTFTKVNIIQSNLICWHLKGLFIVQNSLLIFNELVILQTAYDDLEGTLHCTDSICWFWRDSSLYRHHQMLFVQWRDWVPSRSTNAVCTMNSIWWFLRNSSLYKTHCWSSMDSSLYKQHLLILVCTMMSPFKIIKCSLYNDESLQDQ